MHAVIRVRGDVNLRKEMKDTLRMLRLNRVNHCILIRQDPKLEGMVRKAKDLVTWGEINDQTLEKMISSRGRLPGDRHVDPKNAKAYAAKIKKGEKTGMKPVFRLSPPKKGHEEIKQAYPRGALGYRGEKINELIMRMI